MRKKNNFKQEQRKNKKNQAFLSCFLSMATLCLCASVGMYFSFEMSMTSLWWCWLPKMWVAERGTWKILNFWKLKKKWFLELCDKMVNFAWLGSKSIEFSKNRKWWKNLEYTFFFRFFELKKKTHHWHVVDILEQELDIPRFDFLLIAVFDHFTRLIDKSADKVVSVLHKYFFHIVFENRRRADLLHQFVEFRLQF